MKLKELIKRWNLAADVPVIIILSAVFIYSMYDPFKSTQKTIKIGILHSRTGYMAIDELPMIDALMMAVQEINKKGGLLDHLLQPVIADGASNAQTFAQEAERLINKEKVDVIFGCWTSESRNAVRAVAEKHDKLFFYSVPYEGLEESSNTIYLGMSANQQLVPALAYTAEKLGNSIYFIAHNAPYTKILLELIKKFGALYGITITGSTLISTPQDVHTAIHNITETHPKVIFNYLNGQYNALLFSLLAQHGLTADKLPCMSFGLTEQFMAIMKNLQLEGNYAVWSYFQSIPTDRNAAFIDRFKEQYGSNRVISDPMEASYVALNLWKQAVEKSGTTEAKKVRKALAGSGFRAPGGSILIDENTLHTWRQVRIGKVIPGGQFQIMFSSQKMMEPVPFPKLLAKESWLELHKKLLT